MCFLQLRGLDVDPNGMKLSIPEEEREPIRFYLDELDKYDKGYIGWHWHSQLELMLAREPLDIFVQDMPVHLGPNEGVFINAGVMHMSRSPEGAKGASAYTIVFPPEYIAERSSSIYANCVRPIVENTEIPFVILRQEGWQAQMLSELTHAVQIYRNDMAGNELAVRNTICSAWLKLLHNIEQLRCPMPSRQGQQRRQRLQKMISFVRENYMKQISLDDIAASASVSKSECLRCFCECLNISPVAYLNACRLEIACHMLRRSGMSVREIAMRCGFNDPAYFGRVFKDNFKITPKRYRETK